MQFGRLMGAFIHPCGGDNDLQIYAHVSEVSIHARAGRMTGVELDR